MSKPTYSPYSVIKKLRAEAKEIGIGDIQSQDQYLIGYLSQMVASIGNGSASARKHAKELAQDDPAESGIHENT